ncbi:hypothetical protein NPIL_13631 [Nephila pilipes]|uniref:Uncharacterized protein n=1 Tax=Nephila pilipes TaxID=299642 RepID=A0A8X6QTG2_NEPPI|nr:hypothetical protein NPIL_13631 [Nephila pilipes]
MLKQQRAVNGGRALCVCYWPGCICGRRACKRSVQAMAGFANFTSLCSFGGFSAVRQSEVRAQRWKLPFLLARDAGRKYVLLAAGVAEM